MHKESMTPRERWLAVLERQRPDRLPMDYWATDEATNKLLRHTGCSDLWDLYARLHIDGVVTVEPRYVGPPLDADRDIHGCRFAYVSHADGVYRETVYHPLAEYGSAEEIEVHYSWPSIDWFDFSTIPHQVAGKERYPVRGGGVEAFLIYARLRGMEQAYMDLILDPELVNYCLDKLYDFAYEYSRRIYEQIPGRVDLSYVSEDMGSQQGLLFSPDTLREFLIPRMKRAIDLAHQAGAHVFHHNDGAIRPILPDMIEAGIDILNPIQWRCTGMEREGLKRDFGDRLVFHGGMDNQYTLARGTVEDVRNEVLDNIRLLGEGGGYILAPCHNIQVVSPPENIVAMYQTAYENGWA